MFGTDFQCGALSPDGSVGCVLLGGHNLHQNPMCKNTHSGQSWCGWCGEWKCETHHVDGNPTRVLRDYEINKLMDGN